MKLSTKTKLIGVAAIGLWIVASVSGVFDRPISASRPSPDGSKVAMLAETPKWIPSIDRNFDFAIKDKKTGIRKVVFKSPDEGAAGTERFIWSKNSTHVLLVGRNFSLDQKLQLQTGESVYILFNVDNGQIACNASQRPDYPRVTKEELDKIEFEEPLGLQ